MAAAFVDRSLAGYTIEEITPESDANSLIELISTAFVGGEPLTKSFNLTMESLRPLVAELVEASFKDGLSLLVKENKTNQVVACLLNEDFHNIILDEKEHLNGVPEGLRPILGVLGALEERLAKKYPEDHSKPKQMLHCFMGGTRREHEGKGIGKRLRLATIDFARTKGFKALCVEPTNPITLRIWTSAGGVVEESIVAGEYVMLDGSRPFSNGSLHQTEVVCVRISL